MSKHINMSALSVPICQRVLESLEAYTGQSISRVEEESHFDDYSHFFDAVGALNVSLKHYRHMVDLDDTDYWLMSGDSNTTGTLCIAFEDGNGHITLLRQVCERNKHGVPYVSQAWLPEYNFTKESPISLSEQVDILQKRYYDSSPKKPLVFRYAFMDDEEDERFKMPDEYTQKKLDEGKLRRLPEGYYITTHPSEWKDGEDKTKALAELASTGKFPCPDCEFCKKPKTWEQTKYIKGATFMNKDACLECYEADVKKEEEQNDIEVLVSKGMLKKNSEGEYEFQPVKFTPGRIGRIGGSD